MSQKSDTHHAPEQNDPDNHKHSGSSQHLNLSDQFFASLDRQITTWLNLNPGSRVLDAGCGGCGMTRLLTEAVGPTGEMVAFDTNPELLEWGKAQVKDTELAGRISFQEGDIRNLPFDEGEFDLVWCSRVVHGLGDQLAGVRKLARLLRPGGKLVLREGGLPLQFMPFDLGLGTPGLEGRLAVAQLKWFANWRASLPDGIAYPYGWSHMLAEAGLKSVTGKSFIADFASPLTDEQTQYLTILLNNYLLNPTLRPLVSEEDINTLEQLLDQASPNYIFNRDDLHAIVPNTIYTGLKQ